MVEEQSSAGTHAMDEGQSSADKYAMGDAHSMDNQLRALADPIRQQILCGLARGEAQAGEIAAGFPVSRPAISHHLKVLTEAGLICMRRQAQSRLYSLNAEAVMELRGRFNRFWEDALPMLKATIEADQRAKFAAGGRPRNRDK